jgi:exonuclease III
MKLRIVSYNIDGLPEKLDLADLPWYLTPIAWAYKAVKGTTEIRINDGSNRAEKMKEISEYLNTLNADIIAVQEDFNYHKELMSSLTSYADSTHTGDISLKNLVSKTEWKPLPRFKADGLNTLTTGDYELVEETIVPWKKSNGYVDHANDKLTKKGFRHCVIQYSLFNNDLCRFLDLYVIHMDADFYNPEKCPDVSKDIEARKSQVKQLLQYIEEEDSAKPIIIVGDTNCAEYEWDKETIQLLLDAGFTEAKNDTDSTVDRLFYKDGLGRPIKVSNVEYGKAGLSDHRPLIVDLELDYYG